MSSVRNEKGVTLLEVLLSITILSIVLITFMSFFPQMSIINNQNNDKIKVVNTAKQILIEWQNYDELVSLLKNETFDIPSYKGKDSTFKHHTFEYNQNNFIVKIKVEIDSDLNVKPITPSTKAHFIHIQIYNKNNNLVSETYGYIMVD